MQMREPFETEFLNTRAMQKVRFPILFPLKGSCIELASMGSVHIYIYSPPESSNCHHFR
jgi:hypothetical protein